MNNCLERDFIKFDSPFAVFEFSNLLSKHLSYSIYDYEETVVLCIGTDRSTGDALGPLVGHKLEPHMFKYNNVHLIGTLDEPVHAKNLQDNIDKIKVCRPNAFILAIDASLGHNSCIGQIIIKPGPLNPGLGVNKKLPAIGNLSITGVVNVGGLMEYMVLQNTRLSLVMNMANIIAKGIDISLYKIYGSNLSKKTK